MSKGQSITIIGGGIIGLCSAYYLTKRGFQVTVIERDSFLSGCSSGNAGMIVPSHFIPMSQPGMIAKGIKWMFDSRSPFYVKPRLSGDLLKWGLKFYNSSNRAHVNSSMPILKALNLQSKSLYEELNVELEDIKLQKKGLIMYCKTQKALDEEIEVAEVAGDLGLNVKILTPEGAEQLNPGLSLDIQGGVYYPDDAFLTPSVLIQKLIKFLEANSALLIEQSDVKSIHVTDHSISSIETSKGKFTSNQYVIATGSWTPLLTKKLGINLLMQAGKGYSFLVPQPVEEPQICAILTEAKVAVTPMSSGLRFAGTMEIGGINSLINQKRVEGIKRAIPEYFPAFQNIEFPETEIWSGLRPCSPDGLPYIGRTKKLDNLIIATGHGMMGLSMGPVTGKIVADLAAEEKTDLDLNKVAVERFN